MKKLTILVAVALAVGLVVPSSSGAASLSEVKKLIASDAKANDWFGQSVAVSGDIAVVGAPMGDAGGVGFAGAAYVFSRNQGGTDNWDEVKKLTASDAEEADVFGNSVAVSGDIAVVGAPGDDAGGYTAGAAYVFQRDKGGTDQWGQVMKLTASGGQAGDEFGASVAVSGDVAVVGAAFAGGSGAAYVFQRDKGGTDKWGEVQKLTASDAQAGDRFGWSVAVSADIAVVGAVGEDTWGSNAGAAYVFSRDQGGTDNWGEVEKLTAASDAEAGDEFGSSVAVSGDIAVVGARGEDEKGSAAGAAYVFQRDLGGTDNWGQAQKLMASDGQAGDYFGTSVAVSGDLAVVGADGEDAGGSGAGAAYVFQRDKGGTDNWGEAQKLTASDAEAGDLFGHSVAVSGDLAVVGAFWEGNWAGAAYVFQPPVPVGGTQELPDRAESAGNSSPLLHSALAGLAAGGALLLAAGGAWYARRRWRRAG